MTSRLQFIQSLEVFETFKLKVSSWDLRVLHFTLNFLNLRIESELSGQSVGGKKPRHAASVYHSTITKNDAPRITRLKTGQSCTMVQEVSSVVIFPLIYMRNSINRFVEKCGP